MYTTTIYYRQCTDRRSHMFVPYRWYTDENIDNVYVLMEV